MASGVFNVYSISQITHFYVINYAQKIAGDWTQFFFPLAFNAVYISAFGLFSLIPKNRIPLKVKEDGKEDKIKIPSLRSLIIVFVAITVITAVICFVIGGYSWQNTAI